jgi:hypothetical protein
MTPKANPEAELKYSFLEDFPAVSWILESYFCNFCFV